MLDVVRIVRSVEAEPCHKTNRGDVVDHFVHTEREQERANGERDKGLRYGESGQADGERTTSGREPGKSGREPEDKRTRTGG